MEDQELNSEEEEVATQETDPNESNSVEETQGETPPEVAPPEEDHQERNWRAMERRQKELELEIRRRDEVLDTVLKNQTPATKTVEEDPDDPDEEYVPAGRVRKIASKQVKPLEEKVKQLEAQVAQQALNKKMDSLRTRFSDFDDVVNIETLELLEQNEPELAATIGETTDPYKIGIQSYKYIKALGLVDKLPTAKRKKEIDKKIEKNEKSVQSPTAYEKRPVAQAMKSTAADKKRLYEEMMFYASQASGL